MAYHHHGMHGGGGFWLILALLRHSQSGSHSRRASHPRSQEREPRRSPNQPAKPRPARKRATWREWRPTPSQRAGHDPLPRPDLRPTPAMEMERAITRAIATPTPARAAPAQTQSIASRTPEAQAQLMAHLHEQAQQAQHSLAQMARIVAEFTPRPPRPAPAPAAPAAMETPPPPPPTRRVGLSTPVPQPTAASPEEEREGIRRSQMQADVAQMLHQLGYKVHEARQMAADCPPQKGDTPELALTRALRGTTRRS